MTQQLRVLRILPIVSLMEICFYNIAIKIFAQVSSMTDRAGVYRSNCLGSWMDKNRITAAI